MRVNGARLLAHVLAESGIRYVSGIPGHTIFPFANVIPEEERLSPFLVRHEAIATFAADVHFRVSGRMMAVFVHTLPGAANASVGVANAYAESSALLFIVGETARDASGRGAYQELARGADNDVPELVRHLTKKSWISHNPSQVVEHALRALKLGPSGRPGPVALHVFQDVWHEEIEVPEWPLVEGFLVGNSYRPGSGDVERAAALLEAAERPLIVAGNGVNLGRAQRQLRQLAEQLGVPVATTPTGKGAFPEDHPLSAGVIGWVGTSCANELGRDADVVLAVGARLTETATSSWQEGISFNLGSARLIQIDVEVDQIANVFPVDVALVGDAALTLEALAEATAEDAGSRGAWLEQLERARRDWAAAVADGRGIPGDRMGVGPVVDALRGVSGGQPLTIVCDVGKHHKWVVQQFEAREGDMVISSMGAGTMGIGPCGAVGAALGRPEAKTIAWTGDGGMSMSLPVLATAAEHRLPIGFVVIDDRSFGEIVNIQEERFGRTVFSQFDGTGANPGYELELARVAEACGVPARVVERVEDLPAAFEWVLEADGPVLLDVLVERRSRVPSGGGMKVPDIWNHPIKPWAKAPRVEPHVVQQAG